MTSFTDDFNRADGAVGGAWTQVSGTWSIVSAQLSPGAAGGTIILAAVATMAGNDNFAQVTIAATAAASQGVWCRGSSNVSNGYLFRNNGTSWDLFSVVGGSFVNIGTYAAAASPGDVARVQAVGTTIKGYVNGVVRVSVTDSFVSTGTYVGIRSDSAGALRYDDFSAGDVGGSVTGDASLTATATLTASGQRSTTGDAALTTTASLTATGVRSTSGSASLSASAALTATGTLSATANGTVATTATLTATGQVDHPGQAALSTTATLTAAGVTTSTRGAALTATAMITATGVVTSVHDDLDGDYTVGAPYSRWSVGAPHGSGWVIGPPH